MAKMFSLDFWRAQLEAQGHFVAAWNTVTGFSVRFPQETIITVAVYADEAWDKAYRSRYFVCEPEAEEVFAVVNCPAPHRDRWLKIVSHQPPSDWRDYLAGPGSWMLARLARFKEVVFWSEKGLDWQELTRLSIWAAQVQLPLEEMTRLGIGRMDLPLELRPFFPDAGSPESYRPQLINVDHEQFADVIAGAFLLANCGLRDCYFADTDAMEVYLADRDEKILVSIPNPITRDKLLKQLEAAPWPLKDLSGYTGSANEDENFGGAEKKASGPFFE